MRAGESDEVLPMILSHSTSGGFAVGTNNVAKEFTRSRAVGSWEGIQKWKCLRALRGRDQRDVESGRNDQDAAEEQGNGRLLAEGEISQERSGDQLRVMVLRHVCGGRIFEGGKEAKIAQSAEQPHGNETARSREFTGSACQSMHPVPATAETRPEKKIMLRGFSVCVITRDQTIFVAKQATHTRQAA